MSLEAVRPYFVARLNSVNCTEWPQPFDFTNIPANLIDRSYQLFIGPVSGVQTDNDSIEVNVQVSVNVFFKGFREPLLALDEALIKAQEIVVACASFVNQSGTELKGISFSSLDLDPFDDALNDNIVRALIIFNCRVFICLD